jgi:hypothetical protein
MHLYLNSMHTCLLASRAVNAQQHPYFMKQVSPPAPAVPALQLCAALHGWHGPELLPLAVALQQLQAAQQQQAHQRTPQAAVSQPVLCLLRGGLLPGVGRTDEVAGSSCVRGGGYKAALRSLMRDEALLQALPQDVARSLALTYWHQVRPGASVWRWWLTGLTAASRMVLLFHTRYQRVVEFALLR